MVKDMHRFTAVLAGLIVLVLLVSLTAYLSTWKTPASTQATLVEEQTPEVSGQLLVYVNNRLAYRGQVHSFLKPVPPLLAIGLFPTSSFRMVSSVPIYSEGPSTWGAYYVGTTTVTFRYGAVSPYYSNIYSGIWGQNLNIAPLLLVYDTKGNKWAEISLSTTPNIVMNSTGVLLTVAGSVTPSLSSPSNVSMIRFVRPTHEESVGSTGPPYYALRILEDTLSSPVTVNPGDTLTVVYQFYFKSSQVFTSNWANTTFALLFNVPGAKIPVKTTDGSTDYIDPYNNVVWGTVYPPNNVPVNAYIVVGNGSASFSRTAYKVVSEVARAEPSVQVIGGGVSLSYTFTFSKDTTVTEVAVYSKLSDNKEVMLLYYVLPAPVTAKAGVPFTVTFYISLPYQDRV
jgi:hypothetical protein